MLCTDTVFVSLEMTGINCICEFILRVWRNLNCGKCLTPANEFG